MPINQINKATEIADAPTFPSRRLDPRERKVLQVADSYVPSDPNSWAGAPPTSQDEALDRLAILSGGGDNPLKPSGPNEFVVMQPNGEGGVTAEATSTGVAGGTRGEYAVDFSLYRSTAAHVAAGNQSGLFAGFDNQASGENSVVIGGANNIISATGLSGWYSGIFGGANHVISGTNAFNAVILGGTGSNITDSIYSGILAGAANHVNTGSGYSAILSGESNTLEGAGYNLIGGYKNRSQDNLFGVVLGNFNYNGGSSGGIVFGSKNHNVGSDSLVGGGLNNSYANGNGVGIIFGNGSSGFGINNTVSGGLNNTAFGANATVVGGSTNVAFNTNSVVGGLANWSYGNNSTIFGVGNVANFNSNTVLGRGARATADYDFVVGNDKETGVNQAGFGTVDATYFRLAGDTQSVRIGRPTDQPAADVSQAATISLGVPAVVTVASAPANNSTVRFTTTGSLPAALTQSVTCAVGTTNTWTVPTTQLQNGTAVTLDVATTVSRLPTGFTPGVVYYVVNSSSLTFQLALIPNGTALGSTAVGYQLGTFTVTALGITAGRRYFVVNSSGTTYQLSNSLGGPSLTVYGAQSGTHTSITIARVNTSATNRLYFHTTNASNQSKTISFRAPPTLTVSKDYDLPLVDGSSGQFMRTDGAGVMSWDTTVGTGAKSSAADAGFRGQLSTDGVALYVCTVAGTAGTATWTKATLAAAP